MASKELIPEDAFRAIESKGNPHSVLQAHSTMLARSLERVFSIFEHELSDTYFVQQDLPYGRKVSNNGEWVGHKEPLDESFRISDGFPLAFIIQGALEIYRPGANYKKGRLTEAVLYSGQFVGIFEVIQRFLGREKPISSFWNISSGVTSTYVLDKFTRNHCNALRMHHGVSISPKDINRHEQLIEQCKEYDKVHSQLEKNWSTKVIYFPEKLLELIFQSEDSLAILGDAKRFAALEARRVLGDIALFAYARTFGNSYPLSSYFEQSETQFLSSLISVKNSERPVFAISRNFENSCPSGMLSDDICKNAGMFNGIIAPKRFEKLTACGFIPFNHLVQDNKLHSRDAVHQFFTGIRKKIQNIKQKDENLASILTDTLDGIRINFGKGKASKGICIDGRELEISLAGSPVEFFSLISEIHNWNLDEIPTSDFFSGCVMLPADGN